MKKKPDVHHRIETTLKLSLAVQRDILETDKLILAAITKCHESAITIHAGVPRFASKASLPCHRHFHGHGHKIHN